jgi:hypothetical protein
MLRRVFIALLSTAALLGTGTLTAPMSLAAPSGEAAYADGQVYWMHSSHLVTGASAGLLSAPPIYVLGFPTDLSTGQPILPPGYTPQCDPCNGEPVPYHDHLLTGEPGSGTNGTAGDYRSPWRVVIMTYDPTYVASGAFAPVTSDTQLAAAEMAGEFLPKYFDANGVAQFEVWTNNVLICPLVQAG